MIQDKKVVDLFNNYPKIRSEAVYETKDETKQYEKTQKTIGLKILTPKQMIQKLPIPLALVKASNISEDLLNEIRQIVYSLFQSKKNHRKSIQ